MNTLLFCCTVCGNILSSSNETENVKITLTICCTIVFMALIIALSLLLYYFAKRICDGIHQHRQIKRDYRKEALEYIKKQLEEGANNLEKDCYLEKIEQYTKGCCCSVKCREHKKGK